MLECRYTPSRGQDVYPDIFTNANTLAVNEIKIEEFLE